MNILVLSPALYDTAPGPRFRIEQWARHLVEDGHRFSFVAFEDKELHRLIYTSGNYFAKARAVIRACLRRMALTQRVQDYDLVFIHREAALVGPPFIESRIARTGVPIVYDFDDPIWLRYKSPKNALFARLRFRGKTETICRLANRVVVGNRLLQEWAVEHARQVDVIPSTIDVDVYPIKPEQSGGIVTLGWTGSHSTLPFLDMVLAPLRKVAENQRFRLLVISHTDQYKLAGFPAEVISKRWNAATEAVDLHAMDIGLAPFPNTGWTPWRCHGKVLQYMAAGIPTIASNIGILPEYIEDGVNGFLASSEDEWREKVSILINDRPLRRKMGLAGRKTIEERFSVQAWLPKIREILSSAARRTV